MHNLPTAKQERFFNLLLLPFKAYVIIAPVWLIYSARNVGLAGASDFLFGPSDFLFVAYAICIPFFILAALIQFVAHWRRPAFVSIAFALVAFIVVAILWQLITRSVER
jgi:hypothetical protein